MIADENHHEARRFDHHRPAQGFPVRHPGTSLFGLGRQRCQLPLDAGGADHISLPVYSARPDKGVAIRYLMKASGYSRQQITQLVAQYREAGQLRCRQRTVAGFASPRYVTGDRLDALSKQEKWPP